VLDVSGPPERTGKHRGTNLLNGTVTLPLILARRRDPELAAIDVRAITTPARAAEVCDRIEATDALPEARAQALAIAVEATDALPALDERQRVALQLIAEGVVERYA
jgi:geranylgeranyl pyrophosphate synthase